MKNKEVYKDFIAKHTGNMCAYRTPWEEAVCRGKSCEGCINRFLAWLEQDYMMITPVEREFLANVNDLYNYIGRDANGDLWLYEKPICLNNGVFESNGGRVYKLPDFIAEEFGGIKCETHYNIALL